MAYGIEPGLAVRPSSVTTVKRGQSYGSIASSAGISYADIVRANAGRRARPGTVITVPAPMPVYPWQRPAPGPTPLPMGAYGAPVPQWYPMMLSQYPQMLPASPAPTMLPAAPYVPPPPRPPNYGQTSSPTYTPTTGVPAPSAPAPQPWRPPGWVRPPFYGQTSSPTTVPTTTWRPSTNIAGSPAGQFFSTAAAAAANIWNSLTQPNYTPPGTPHPPAVIPPNQPAPRPPNLMNQSNGVYDPQAVAAAAANAQAQKNQQSWVTGNANRVSYAPLYPGGPLVPITPRPSSTAGLTSQQAAAVRDYQTAIRDANIAVATPTKNLTVDSQGNIIRAPSWTGLEVMDLFDKNKFPSIVFAQDFQMADYQSEGALSAMLDQNGYRQIAPGVFARVKPQPVWNAVTKSWDTVRPPGSYWAGMAKPTGVGVGYVPPEGDPMWNDYASIYAGTMRPEDEKKRGGGGGGGYYGGGFGGRGGGGRGGGYSSEGDSIGYNPYVDYGRTLEAGASKDNAYFGGGRTSNGRYYNPQFLGAINWRGI